MDDFSSSMYSDSISFRMNLGISFRFCMAPQQQPQQREEEQTKANAFGYYYLAFFFTSSGSLIVDFHQSQRTVLVSDVKQPTTDHNDQEPTNQSTKQLIKEDHLLHFGDFLQPAVEFSSDGRRLFIRRLQLSISIEAIQLVQT